MQPPHHPNAVILSKREPSPRGERERRTYVFLCSAASRPLSRRRFAPAGTFAVVAGAPSPAKRPLSPRLILSQGGLTGANSAAKRRENVAPGVSPGESKRNKTKPQQGGRRGEVYALRRLGRRPDGPRRAL